MLLPPRIESSLWLKLFRKLLYWRPRRSYRHSIISTLTILQSASCFQHFFVVKYNPVSQLKFMLLFIESIGPYSLLSVYPINSFSNNQIWNEILLMSLLGSSYYPWILGICLPRKSQDLGFGRHFLTCHVKEMSFFLLFWIQKKNWDWVWIDRRVVSMVLQLPSEMVHRAAAFEISDLKNDIHQLC